MTLQTIAFITRAVPVLERYGRSTTDVFYQNLFSLYPELKNIFIIGKQIKEGQSPKLSDEALTLARYIENPDALLPSVSRITRKHASSGVKQRDYIVIGDAPLATIQHVLPPPDGHPTLTSWANAYRVLTDLFIQVDSAIEHSIHNLPDRWYRSASNYMRNYCSATDEQLDKTVVLELIGGIPGRIIPTANLVRIQ